MNRDFAPERLDVAAFAESATPLSAHEPLQTYGRLLAEAIAPAIEGAEPNCFYAFENGHVKGVPFRLASINADVAAAMVRFGCEHVVIWPLSSQAV